MDIQEILEQPDGFTPPSVTVKIEKVFPRKSGEGENGPWSFQAVKVNGGELKLKNLDEFPADRIGETVTLRAFSSPKHGLTGMKVAHESYQGKTYNKLHITPTCIWEWAEPNKNGSNGHPASNGNGHVASTVNAPAKTQSIDLAAHLMCCADIADKLAVKLNLLDDSARQACFATVCIDAQRHNVILGAVDRPEPPSTNREVFLKSIQSACKLLNGEGYTPPMTRNELNKYINEEFQVEGGLDALTATEDLEDLLKRLSDKLDNFRANKSAFDDEPPDDDWS